GIDEISGFLQWGMIEWRSEGFPIESVPQITVSELAEWLEQGRDVGVIDLREHAEGIDRHIAGALHLRMLAATAPRAKAPAERTKAVLCAGGLRSSTAISALKRHGLSNWFNVTGGMTAWKRFGYPVVRSSSDPASSPRA